MKTIHTLLFGAIALSAIANSAAAQSYNTDFTSGLGGWNVAGDASITDGSFGLAPSLGSQVLLSTINPGAGVDGIPSYSGNGAQTATTLENLLGLSGGSLVSTGAIEGSAIARTLNFATAVTLNISFEWAFLSNEFGIDPARNDYAFFSVNGVAYTLADVNTGAFDDDYATDDFDLNTLYSTFNISVDVAAGDVVIGFGVVDVDTSALGSATIPSALLIGNLDVSAVPEPAHYALAIGGGLIALIVIRRRNALRK